LSRHKLAHLPVVNHASEVKAPHDKSMLEELGIDHRDTSTQYSKAIKDYLKSDSRTASAYKTMCSIMGSKVLLTKYAPPAEPVSRFHRPRPDWAMGLPKAVQS
jgi:hypothetical protein